MTLFSLESSGRVRTVLGDGVKMRNFCWRSICLVRSPEDQGVILPKSNISSWVRTFLEDFHIIFFSLKQAWQ
jgi:hypothetical protein